jgi:cell division protein FtsL
MNAAARLANQHMLSRRWALDTFFEKPQLLLLSLLLAVLISAVGVISLTNSTRALHADLEQAQFDAARFQTHYSQLLLERSTWAAQARVEKIANNELNMEAPTRTITL